MWCSEIYDRDLTSVGRIHDAMIQRGGGGGGQGLWSPLPLKNHKKYILNRIPWKIKKLLSQQCWAIISTPAKRHLCSARLFQSSLCSKQCGSGLNCSPESSLIQVHNVCLYGEISHWRKHKLHFPYITTHMSSTSSLLKDVFEGINIDPDLIGAVWSWSQMFVCTGILAIDVSISCISLT